MTPTIPNLTIIDLYQFNFRDSLEDFEVDCLQSLNNLLFGGLREFYKQDGCILNKERYFLSMFNTAYYISSKAIKEKRPSLLRAEYEHLASKAPSDIEILPPGDPWRKYNIMTMVYCILSTNIKKVAPTRDLRNLLDDIRSFSINLCPRLYEILDRYLRRIVNEKKAKQLCLSGLFLQGDSNTLVELENANVAAFEEDKTILKSPFTIVESKQTSVLVVLETMYKAGWIRKVDGSEYTNRDEMIKDVMRILFNQEEVKGIKQKLNSSRNRTLDGQRKYFEDLLKYTDNNSDEDNK